MKKEGSNWRTLLNRWISGQITAREEQELDRSAQEDPFLSDALEGYRKQPEGDHARQVTKLKAKFQKKQKRRGIPLWRIAAAVAILVVAGVAMWQINTNGGQDLAQMEMAVEESLPTPNTFDTNPPPTSYDHLASEEPTDEIAPNQDQLAHPTNPSPSSKIKTKKQTQQTSPVVAPPPTAVPKGITPAEPSIAKETPEADLSEIASPEQVTAKKVLTEVEEALPKTREKTEKKRVANVPSNYQAHQPENATPTGKRDSLTPNLNDSGLTNPIIAMQEQNRKRRKKVQEANAYTIPATPNVKALNPVAPRPSIDSTAYRKYIKDNLRYPAAAKAAGATGAVTLRFSFDENGKPFNFLLLKSMGYGCDEEAIRLIREGPAWIAPDYSIKTYTIHFDL